WLPIRGDENPASVGGVAAQGSCDGAPGGRGDAGGDGEVEFAHRAALELAHQGTASSDGLGEEHNTGGLAVEPVEQPGASLATARLAGEDGVGQCTAEMLVGGMDD